MTERPPAAAPSPWIAFSAVAVGTFMATLDGSIVNVALPTLGLELNARIDRLQWIVAAYLLTLSATLLVAGRLGDLMGHRRAYAAGLVLFTAGSALCGAAPSLEALVAARVVQALGASLTMAVGPAVLTAAFPPQMRGRALGSFGSVVSVGLTVGPPIGGAIVQALSWRWIFLVNLPVGIAGVAWALRVLPRGDGARGGRFDLAGILRLAVAPRVGSGLLAGLLSYVAIFTSTLLTPFLLSRVFGLSAGRVGAYLVAVPLAMAISSPLSGWLSDRCGGRWLGPLGSGGGLLGTARNLGMVVGVSAAGALFAHHAGDGLDPATFLHGYAVALRAGAAVALLAGIVSLARAPERTA